MSTQARKHAKHASTQARLARDLADSHTSDAFGWMLLHFAVQNGNQESVVYFVDLGTDIHLKTNNGLNRLHIAALSGHLSICRTLVEKHKFDIHIADNDGWTALHYSVRNGCYELIT